MAYEIDVLIAYAEADNHPTEFQQGWVEDFKKFLELVLIQVVGNKPNILLKSEHDELAGADMSKVATFMPVLSHSYLASPKCMGYLEDFVQSAGKEANSRIFKVLKRPLLVDEQPPVLSNQIGYELFNINVGTGETEDYTNFFTFEAERGFWMKMVDLAYDIQKGLLDLNTKSVKSEIKSIYSNKSVYLAETGHDLVIQRNIIKRELQRHGYRVLPDHILPSEVQRLKKVVIDQLEECNYSIHLIGNSYGGIPEGSDKSIVDLQNQFSAEKSARVKDKTKFARLIWIAPRLDYANERQLAFIEGIKRDISSTEGAEILQTPLEDFKNIIREQLIEKRLDIQLVKREVMDDQAGQNVYIVHDKMDSKPVNKLKTYLEKAGYNVLTPTFEGQLLDLRQHHINNLRELDAAIIYQGGVNDQWVRMKLLDLLKAPGFGRNKPIKGKAIISEKKQQIDLKTFGNQEITLIDRQETKALEKELKVFLEELNETSK
ncbi:DUF4062 domain-containing protein [Fulvivirga sp. M361]|uniref:DUF4062 domain-containing protein n=1 Tax=Fulvivirga sp. M361 TaxID=2594266 RepID=UPI001179E7A6|nr:DUF4062 domain-containing protein [Fulvivirga sp. M361]TRX52628.1 DUF4062 domain-containing protein [Fulvivirga sp. M361]